MVVVLQYYSKQSISMSLQQTIERWAVNNYDPWANIREQQPPNYNYIVLCRALMYSNNVRSIKRIIEILTTQFHRSWSAIRAEWEQEQVLSIVPLLFGQYPRGRWMWNPRADIREDPATLSYLCLKVFHKCFYCGGVIVPMGDFRKNGACRKDWVSRKGHVRCYRQHLVQLRNPGQL